MDPSQLSSDTNPSRKLELALARRFHDDTAAGVLGHPLVAVVLAFLVWGYVPDAMALGSVLVLLFATLARIRLHRSASRIGELHRLARRTRWSSLAVAFGWALVALVLLPRVPPEVGGRILVIFAGVVSAGVVTYQADRTGFRLFAGFLLGSAFVATLLAGVDRLRAVDLVAVLAFWGMVEIIHRRTYRRLRAVMESGARLKEATLTATRRREFLDAVLRGAPNGVLLIDPEGRIARANLEAERILGAPEATLKGRAPAAEAERGPVWTALARVAEEAEDDTPADVDVEAPGLKVPWCHVSAVHGREAATGWTLIHLQDVTGIREAELARKEAEADYADLVESAHDLIWKWDDQGCWTFVNRAAENIYGAEPAQLLGHNVIERAPERRRDADRRAFQHILAGGDLVNFETVHLTLAGEERVLSFSARPLRDREGGVVGAQGVARDVTVQVRAREAMRDLAERTSLVRSLINASQDLIFYKGPDGVYRGCNWAFAERLDRTEEDVVGQTDAELFGAELASRFAESDRLVLETREPVSGEDWVTTADGKEQLVETVKTVYEAPDGAVLGILGVARDVTERKQQEERMREMAEEAEHATRMKSAFLANMSHEIRTPMNGVLGMAELLQFTDLDDEQRGYVDVIRSSADNLLGILNDILDLSKIEAEKLELEEVSYDLPRMLADAIRVLAIPASARHNELLLDIDGRVPRWVKGDPIRVRQVVTNLVGNAIKFTEKGEVLITVRRREADDGLPVLHIGVRDTGIGISPEKHAAIFRDFEQADTSVTRRYGGTGLGLAISSRLVELMGGRMGLESEVGVGSNFWLDVPLCPSEPDLVDAEEAPTPESLAGVRVLVVDDHPTNRDIVRRVLESVEAEVFEADGSEATFEQLDRAQAAGEPPSVLLLDVQMPGVDGIQIAERLLTSPHAGIPILVLTSANRPEDARRARELGVEGYHLKPLPRDELLRAVASAVGRGEAPAEGVGLGLGAGPGGRVLVAEDNQVNRLVAQSILAKAGYQIEVAENGQQAVELVSEGRADLVLMDVQMPVMDGLDATRRIRERETAGAHIPIVALTAHAFGEEEARCRAAGMDAFLSKPFHAQDLLRLVRRLIPSHGRVRGPTPVAGAGASPPPAQGSARAAAGSPVDLEAFREGLREAGIEEVAEATLELFLQDMTDRRRHLEEARVERDLERVARAAHALKSGAGNVRADRIHDLLRDIEERANAGDDGVLGPILDRALMELDRVEHYLNERGVGGSD